MPTFPADVTAVQDREGDVWRRGGAMSELTVDQLLDDADAILRVEPRAGDRLDVIQAQLIRAQLLLLRAQSKILRDMR